MIAATIPDATRLHIERFDKAVSSVQAAPTDGHRTARRGRVHQLGGELKTHADSLVEKLEKGEAWLNTSATVGPNGERNTSDHPQWAQREAQWFSWEAEYRAVMDALERGKAVL